jgi:hypothetical protein
MHCEECGKPVDADGYCSYCGTVNEFETVTCKFCHKQTRADTAHLHQGAWVGDECCWDERLRSTE